jgi:hypothetical protein
MDVSELENGNVVVKIRSRRGTGTRDQDEVTVEAVYENVNEAERESERMNRLVEERMEAAREVGNFENSDLDGSSPATEDEPRPDLSKIYLGDGSRIKGWISRPRQIIFEEIAPLVSKNEVEDEHTPTVQVNFSKDVPASGWTEVDAQAVSEKIEPLVRRHRVDKD